MADTDPRPYPRFPSGIYTLSSVGFSRRDRLPFASPWGRSSAVRYPPRDSPVGIGERLPIGQRYQQGARKRPRIALPGLASIPVPIKLSGVAWSRSSVPPPSGERSPGMIPGERSPIALRPIFLEFDQSAGSVPALARGFIPMPAWWRQAIAFPPRFDFRLASASLKSKREALARSPSPLSPVQML